MTKNQIEYAKLQETKRYNSLAIEETMRANRAQEELTQWRDLNTIALRAAELGETNRHNVAGETELNRHQLAVEGETHRHNLQDESIRRASVGAQYAQVQLGYAQLDEAMRHNRAGEEVQRMTVDETVRHNMATEDVANINAGSQAVSADASASQAETAQFRAETEAELVPYKKFSLITEGIKDIAIFGKTVADGLTKGVSNTNGYYQFSLWD